MRRLFAFIVCFLTSAWPSHAAGHDVLPRSEIDRLVKPIMDGQWAHAIVIGLIDEHGRQFVGYGRLSDKNSSAPDAQSVFEIGSVSKTFTATLLALAVQRNQMRLEDPVQNLLPGVKIPQGKNHSPITLVQLATHTSGLPRLPSDFLPADFQNPYADYTAERLYNYLSLLNLPTEPGQSCSYSNLGVGLLGHALAVHSHKDYESLLLEQICGPLQMNSTRITLDDSMRRRLATGYDADGVETKNWDLNVFAGAGGIRSTADDMLNYVEAQIGLRSTELDKAIELTHQRQRAFDKFNDIALVWMIQKNGALFHNGQTGGYHANVCFDCKKRLGIVVLSTTSIHIVDAMADRLFRRMQGQAVDPPHPRQTIQLDPTTLDRYVGEYKLGTLSWITIAKSNDHLTARITGQPTCRIYPETPTKFFWKVADAQVTFDSDGNEPAKALILHQNGEDVRAVRTK